MRTSCDRLSRGAFTPRRWKWRALAMVPVCLALGCDRGAVKPRAQDVPKVETDTPVSREVTDVEEFVGQTAAVLSVEVRARVTGYLDKVNFKVGEEVKEGDVLFDIDPRSYQAEVDRSEAAVNQSDAHYKRLRSNYDRARSLAGREVLSAQEFDQVSGDYNEAGAMVGAAQANLKLTRLNLSFTRVLAPFSGRASRNLVDPGNLVKADDTILTSIVALDPMLVYFDIDERTLLRLRRLVNQGKIRSRRQGRVPIFAALADEEGFPHEGYIDFSENRLDATTGTLRVRARVPNPEPRVLSPGFFMRVQLPIGVAHRAILIPEQALGTDQGRKYIYVVTKNPRIVEKDAKGQPTGKTHSGYQVDYRALKVGALQEGGLRVVETGLSEGESFVVTGLQRIRPGIEVKPSPVSKSGPDVRTGTSPKVAAGGAL